MFDIKENKNNVYGWKKTSSNMCWRRMLKAREKKEIVYNHVGTMKKEILVEINLTELLNYLIESKSVHE